MLGIMFLYCWRINLVCLAVKLVGSWVELGFSVGIETLEKEMATHSSVLAWRIPWREEPGRLQSIGS